MSSFSVSTEDFAFIKSVYGWIKASKPEQISLQMA
jgi:hypothetical protein